MAQATKKTAPKKAAGTKAKKPTAAASRKAAAPKTASVVQERTSNSPSSGEALGTYPVNSPEDVLAAVKRAREAQPKWAAIPMEKRIDYMRRVKRDILNNMSELAELISKESGKPRCEAHNAELVLICDLIDYFAKEAPKILAEEKLHMPQVVFKTKSARLLYDPLGVIGVISPWNWPFSIPMSEIVMALICGNTVVLKPAELTSLCGIKVGEIFDRAGVPEGVVNVVTGSGTVTGQALVEAEVDKIVFTGSVEVGRHIMQVAAKRLCPSVLELGGKDPMVVLEDAHLSAAVEAAVWGSFFNAGQVCAGVERVYVHENIYEEFVRQAVEKTKTLRVGDPLDPEMDMGAMIDHKQVMGVHKQVQAAIKAGATCHTGGEPVEPVKGGSFYPPTILTGVDHTMEIMWEETFGPVMPIMPFKDEAEAIRLANDTKFGLSASVFGKDLKNAEKVARKIWAGTVSVNDCSYAYGLPQVPWGGVKESGVGRTHSKFGLYEFVTIRHLGVEHLGQMKKPYWYPYSKGAYDTLKKLTSLVYSDNVIEGAMRIMGQEDN